MTLNRLHVLLLWTTWCVLVFLVPTTVGLRDSGEFLVAPVFLDIVHSAGFPTFSQIANLFTFLPIGPLTFRVHLFAALCSVGLIALTMMMTRRLTRPVLPDGSEATIAVATVAAALSLIGTTPFWRGALSSEAYILNCVLTFVAFLIVIWIAETKDARWIPFLGVLTGVGLGNHVILAPIAVATVAILVFRRPPLSSIILGGVFAVLSGLAVYAYLPIRALTSPPLNTGSPDTPIRIWNHLSNARDAALRPASAGGLSDGVSSIGLLLSDLGRLTIDTSILVSGLALLGFFCLLIRSRFQAALLGSLLFITLYFFSGWELEPWIPASVTVAITAGIGCAVLLQHMRNLPVVVQGVVVFAIMMGISAPLQDRSLSLTQPTSNVVDAHARALLRPLPPQATLVTEPSWFILRHITAVSGYRDDTDLIYQPGITFPEYFDPLQWKDEPISPTTTTLLATPAGRMAAFVDHASRFGPLYFEPTPLLTESFRGILTVSGSPFPSAQRGIKGSVSDGAGDRFSSWIKKLKMSSRTSREIFSADIDQYSEVLGNNFAALFSALDRHHDANIVFESMCLSPFQCLPQSANNYSLTLLRLSRPCEAKIILERSISDRAGSVPGAIFHNLRIAHQACASSPSPESSHGNASSS